MKSPFQSLPKDLQIAPGQQLLKATDYATYLDAQAVLEAARRRAAEIEADAKATFEAERQRGYQQGVAEAKQAMSEQLSATVAATAHHLDSVERQLIDLVLTSVTRIVGEFEADELALRLVRKGLSAMRGAQQIKLRLAPARAQALEQRLAEEFPDVAIVDVIADPDLADDDCLLESELGTVNASASAQIDALLHSFNEHLKLENDKNTGPNQSV